MGYHIGITKKDYKAQHGEWDSLRYTEDWDFISLFEEKNKIYPKWNTYGGIFKPKDINEARIKLNKSNIEYKERYLKLLLLLEDSNRWWIDYS